MGRESLNYRRGRGGRPFERAKAECFATETHCRRCGKRVDMTLPYKDPTTGRVNTMSKSYGHSTELDAGGHPYVGHLEHLGCNSKAGAEYVNEKRRKQTTELRTSRDW
ncbi:hypothetical protein [Herbiconiux sp. VKM Ac-2851]|uniref:hypothetical protein n=1 Tax=Herbiconiux sp. VKM Ac-2851 TaxID=2739025 RepID=UPI00156699F0|nr:hypothetical protein [Herbiconiux sp. VKM Ac-2851]NQX36262.1 hypothetical protein [Herbiconiux sp. VKM Ac-2851]